MSRHITWSSKSSRLKGLPQIAKFSSRTRFEQNAISSEIQTLSGGGVFVDQQTENDRRADAETVYVNRALFPTRRPCADCHTRKGSLRRQCQYCGAAVCNDCYPQDHSHQEAK